MSWRTGPEGNSRVKKPCNDWPFLHSRNSRTLKSFMVCSWLVVIGYSHPAPHVVTARKVSRKPLCDRFLLCPGPHLQHPEPLHVAGNVFTGVIDHATFNFNGQENDVVAAIHYPRVQPGSLAWLYDRNQHRLGVGVVRLNLADAELGYHPFPAASDSVVFHDNSLA